MRVKVRFYHIVTVGTSIVRNTLTRIERCLSAGEDCPDGFSNDELREVASLLKDCGFTRPGTGEDVDCMTRVERSSALEDLILYFLRKEPAQLSAELNALLPWLRAWPRDHSFIEKILLLPTETAPGLLSGRTLRRHLRGRIGSRRVEMQLVPGWYENVWRGGLELYGIVVDEIRSTIHSGSEWVVLLNATGGFKPETAYLVMAGLHYGDERAGAYYIHELHRRHTLIPLIPPGGPSMEEAVRLVTSALNTQRGPKIVLGGDLGRADWLRWYAKALEPLGEGRLLDDGRVELSADQALYISMLYRRR